MKADPFNFLLVHARNKVLFRCAGVIPWVQAWSLWSWLGASLEMKC